MDAVAVEENRAAQAEEMEALRSIYGEECSINTTDYVCKVQVSGANGNSQPGPMLQLCVYFPELYPSMSYPIVEFNAPWLAEDARQRLSDSLVKIFEEAAGDVIVFKWVEWLKEQIWLWEEAEHWWQTLRPVAASSGQPIPVSDDEATPTLSQCPMPEGRAEDGRTEGSRRLLDEKSLQELDRVLGIVHGAPFTEKKSTFQGHLAAVTSVDQVETVMDALLRNRKIAGATHNIMAYRIVMPAKNAVLQDSDDDGETAAGRRVLHLLQIVDALNVVVVVSRWYGGILLGPDRFKHINNAARSILGACGYIEGSGSSNSNHKFLAKGNPSKGKKR